MLEKIKLSDLRIGKKLGNLPFKKYLNQKLLEVMLFMLQKN